MRDTTVYSVNISNVNNEMFSVKARSVTDLDLPEQNVSQINFKKYSHLRAIKNKLSQNVDLKPEMLIGQDNVHLIIPLEVRSGKLYEPLATRTPLGWSMHGVVRDPHVIARSTTRHSALLLSAESRDLHELHEFGVTGKPRHNSEYLSAQAKLEQTATLVNDSWQVELPSKLRTKESSECLFHPPVPIRVGHENYRYAVSR